MAAWSPLWIVRRADKMSEIFQLSSATSWPYLISHRVDTTCAQPANVRIWIDQRYRHTTCDTSRPFTPARFKALSRFGLTYTHLTDARTFGPF